MKIPKTVSGHHKNVRSLRCVVTQNPTVTIHHCHSGSMADFGYVRGTSQRGVGEALVLPLKADFHCFDYAGNAIDGSIGIRTWEEWYGTQMQHLHDVSALLGYNVFKLHAEWTDGKSKQIKRA